MLSLLTQCEWIYFLDLVQLKNLLFLMHLKPRKGVITIDTNDQFFALTIEIFGYLQKHADVFLHDCANAIWSLKGIEGLHIPTLVTFFHQKISITLQRMQSSSILSRVIAIGFVTS
jgi:hypothetical protein